MTLAQPPQPQRVDVAIVGAGPVGLFAAFQCGMLGLSCALVDALAEPGGQCSALYPEKPIYDIPAWPRLTAGALVAQLVEQAAPFEPRYLLNNQVSGLARDPERGGWLLRGARADVAAGAVILATGAGAIVPNRPALAGIAAYENRSLFYAVRDPSMFAGKRVTIAGGGDSALDWTLALAGIAAEVRLVHRRPNFRAAPASLQRLAALQAERSVRLLAPAQLTQLVGHDGHLQAVQVLMADGELMLLPTDYLLLFYGLVNQPGPLAHWGLDLQQGTVRVAGATMQSTLEGVFAAGDGASYPGKLKLILTGFAEAALAVRGAYAACHPGRLPDTDYSTSKGLPVAGAAA